MIMFFASGDEWKFFAMVPVTLSAPKKGAAAGK